MWKKNVTSGRLRVENWRRKGTSWQFPCSRLSARVRFIISLSKHGSDMNIPNWQNYSMSKWITQLGDHKTMTSGSLQAMRTSGRSYWIIWRRNRTKIASMGNFKGQNQWNGTFYTDGTGKGHFWGDVHHKINVKWTLQRIDSLTGLVIIWVFPGEKHNYSYATRKIIKVKPADLPLSDSQNTKWRFWSGLIKVWI